VDSMFMLGDVARRAARECLEIAVAKERKC
jgi:hypothetical protein